MSKIFTSEQIRAIDKYTIDNEPVSPLDLMERASYSLFLRIRDLVSHEDNIMVFAGTGNNGGDGIVISSMLRDNGYRTELYVVNISANRSEEWDRNLVRFKERHPESTNIINSESQLPIIPTESIVIDAVFGSGLTREPEGIAAEVIKTINSSGSRVISVDVPSGLSGEENSGANPESVIKATHTLAIQFPRLSFFFPENERFTGKWEVVPIGLHPVAISATPTPWYQLKESEIRPMLRRRGKFDHKGTYGHALLAAGSPGKIGAAVLAARAALRSGAGLVTCHVPGNGNNIMQISVPEAMTVTDVSDILISGIENPEKYDAVAFGPGIGTKPNTCKGLYRLITEYDGPLVIDADGLNILAMNREWYKLIPKGSVLTPHPGEFERMTQRWSNSYSRLMGVAEFSSKYEVTVVLKGAHTLICTPEGKSYFNSTGNPGMATAGSGDVLTGIILSLLAQGYEGSKAALVGVYLHGLAGDIAAAERGMEALIASDIIEKTGEAYKKTAVYVL